VFLLWFQSGYGVDTAFGVLLMFCVSAAFFYSRGLDVNLPSSGHEPVTLRNASIGNRRPSA
jgi:biopolymer transport protein ExbD